MSHISCFLINSKKEIKLFKILLSPSGTSLKILLILSYTRVHFHSCLLFSSCLICPFVLLEISPDRVCNSNFYTLKIKLKTKLHQPQLLLLCFTILRHLLGYSPHQNTSCPQFQRKYLGIKLFLFICRMIFQQLDQCEHTYKNENFASRKAFLPPGILKPEAEEVVCNFCSLLWVMTDV